VSLKVAYWPLWA